MSASAEDPLAEVNFRFAAARLWAVHRAPYLTSALYLLRPRLVEPRVDEQTGELEADERFASFPTGTDWSVHLDPGTVLRTEPAVIGWWLLHHVGHLVREHARRSPVRGTFAAGTTGFRDPEAVSWNQATDAEVNDDLDGERFACPADVLTPDRWGMPRGLVAEEYVSRIEVLPYRVRDAGGVDCGSCADGAPREWDDTDLGGGEGDRPSDLDLELLSRSIRSDILKRMAGRSDLPGGWARWADRAAGAATVDWRRVLRSVLSKSAGAKLGAVDFAYARPARRAAAYGDIVIPAMVKPSPRPGLLIDTSCSIGATLLADVVAEVDALVRVLCRTSGAVPVVCCDVVAAPVQRLRDPRGLVLHGGGGTDLRVGFEALAHVKPRPDLVVVVTDGDTPWPERPPRGTLVVVLLVDGPREVPAWARTVVSDDDAARMSR